MNYKLLTILLIIICILPCITGMSKADEFQFFKHSTVKITSDKGTGSGFIITPKGHVLTSKHVVDGSTSVKITLANGKRFLGRVIKVDEKYDIALLKFESKNLPAVRLGDVNGLKKNERVLTCFFKNHQPEVRKGVILSTDRRIKNTNYIHSTIKLQSGSSGGAVFNAEGEVIGINTYGLKGNGGSLALPVSLAIEFLTVEKIPFNVSLDVSISASGQTYEGVNPNKIGWLLSSFYTLSIALVLIPAVIVWLKRKNNLYNN